MASGPKKTGEKRKSTPKRDEKGRFLPGVVQNPKGRPKGTLSIVPLLKKKLADIEPKTGRQYAELLVERMVQDAIAFGDHHQIKNILQYVDGMPQQKLDLTSNESPLEPGTPIIIIQDNGDPDPVGGEETTDTTVSEADRGASEA